MSPPGGFPGAGRLIALAVLAMIAALYVAAAKLGLSIAFLHPSATPVWPPAGIALAALLIVGRRAWPAILVGAWLANVGITGWTLTTFFIATGNTLEAMAGAWLVERFAGGCRAFERVSDLFRFVGLAAFGSTIVSATIGVTSLVLGGFAGWSGYGPIWLTWWLGDVAGDLLVAPPLVLWATLPRPAWSVRRTLEAIALFGLLILVAHDVFVGRSLPESLTLKFLCIPFLIWAALRFDRRIAATAMLVLAAIATWGILSASDHLVVTGGNQRLLLLQAFLGMCSITCLALAASAAETRSAHTLLEDRVEQRTHELASALRRLQDAQEALVRREKLALLGQLASGVGHELRNPLGVMSNAVHYLEQVLTSAPVKVGEYLQLLRRQITLSDRIVGDLLDLARIGPGRKEDVRLREVVQRQLERLGSLDGVALRMEVPDDLPPVQADEVQVGQIIFNLLTNSVQAMGEDGGTLMIRAGCDTPQRARLEVVDSGPGIRDEDQEKIFEPLFSTKARGMGLGLAISRALARANAGDITVSSRAGAGATFTLTLPIAQRAEAS